MVRSISILGSTGSIGRQTVAVAEHLGLRVRAISTNRSIALAEEQARRLKPAMVAVTDETAAKALRVALADTDIKVWGGAHALVEAAVVSETDAVVTAVATTLEGASRRASSHVAEKLVSARPSVAIRNRR